MAETLRLSDARVELGRHGVELLEHFLDLQHLLGLCPRVHVRYGEDARVDLLVKFGSLHRQLRRSGGGSGRGNGVHIDTNAGRAIHHHVPVCRLLTVEHCYHCIELVGQKRERVQLLGLLRQWQVTRSLVPFTDFVVQLRRQYKSPHIQPVRGSM